MFTAEVTAVPFAQTRLRRQLDRTAPGSLVGGDAAVRYDVGRVAHRDILVLVPLVLVVIFLVIAMLLRAPLAPLILIDTLLARTVLVPAAFLGIGDRIWWPAGTPHR